MKTTLQFLTALLFLLIFLHPLKSLAQSDSTSLIHGTIFEILDDTTALPYATIYFVLLDSTMNAETIDSCISDENGIYSMEIDSGYYTIISFKQDYDPLTIINSPIFADSVYEFNLELGNDSFLSNSEEITINGPFTEPVVTDILISNPGSGSLNYSATLYLSENLPEDIQTYKGIERLTGKTIKIPQERIKTYSSRFPSESAWKLLYRDPQDQNSGNHDIKNLWMQQDESNFYVKTDFYDAFGSFDKFFYLYFINVDRDNSTGVPGDGFDYLIAAANFNGYIGAILLQYINNSWYYVMDAPYSNMFESRDYIIFGLPKYIFEDYDVMLSFASVSPADGDYTYYDGVPDWQNGNFFLFSIDSDPSIQLDKYYGNARHGQTDSLHLILMPEIADNPLDTFYIGILSSDNNSPINIIKVNMDYQNEPLVITGIINSLCDVTVSPNPFTDNINIGFYADRGGIINVMIYQSDGKLIKKIIQNTYSAGYYEINWDGTDMNHNDARKGVYLYSVRTTNHKYFGKIVRQ